MFVYTELYTECHRSIRTKSVLTKTHSKHQTIFSKIIISNNIILSIMNHSKTSKVYGYFRGTIIILYIIAILFGVSRRYHFI